MAYKNVVNSEVDETATIVETAKVDENVNQKIENSNIKGNSVIDDINVSDSTVVDSKLQGVKQSSLNVSGSVSNSEITGSDLTSTNKNAITFVSKSNIKDSSLTDFFVADAKLNNVTLDDSNVLDADLKDTVVINSKVEGSNGLKITTDSNEFGRPVFTDSMFTFSEQNPKPGDLKIVGPVEFKGYPLTDNKPILDKLNQNGVDTIEVSKETTVKTPDDFEKLANSAIEKQNAKQEFNFDGLDSAKGQEL